MKLLLIDVDADSHGRIDLTLIYDVFLCFWKMVETAAGGTAGQIHGADGIDGHSATSVIIICEDITVPVGEGGTGVDMIVAGEHQVDLVISSDAGQIFAHIGAGILGALPGAGGDELRRRALHL